MGEKKSNNKRAGVNDYLVYAIYRIFELFLRLFPMEVVCLIGAGLGQLAYFLMPRRRHSVHSIIGTGKNELPKQLLQTILDDTLNRTQPIQLTTALKVLEGTHTSVIEEATDLLEFHLEEEHGTDIQKWTKSVDAYIAAEKNSELLTP